LRKIVPELVVVPDSLRVNLFEPILAGRPLKMAEVDFDEGNTSFKSVGGKAIALGGEKHTLRPDFRRWETRRGWLKPHSNFLHYGHSTMCESRGLGTGAMAL
jgi:hypothetical protein